jgi:hypothetical protein
MANKQNMQLWIDGLLSNRFKQGRRRLKRNGEYCCLGVACEVAKENGVELPEVVREGGAYFGAERTDGYLPREVMQWLDIEENDPLLVTYAAAVRATSANDYAKWSFKEIAEAIKKTYIDTEEA